MNANLATSRRRAARALILAGSALGTLLVTAAVQAQNVSSNGSTDYSLSETGTRAGGPRTVDITTSGGAITLDLGTVQSANNTAALGAGIAATNNGTGNIAIKADTVTATGSGITNGVDARANGGGDVTITTGTVDSSANSSSRGIQAGSAGGNIIINADVTNGGQRGIFTGPLNNIFPNSVTITSNTATASGTNSPNAIVGQGQSVSITSGVARNTNAAAISGTAIFANAGTGGAVVHSGTAEALGNYQSAIQVYSDGAVLLDSDSASTTQTSDGLSVMSGTDVTINSGTVTTQGNGARGIVVDTPGATSLNITSGTITTKGDYSTGMLLTPGAAATTIASTSVETLGSNADGIDLNGTGSATITSGSIHAASGTGINVAAGDIAVTTTGDTVSDTSGAIQAIGKNVTIATGSGTNTTAGGTASAIYASGSGDVSVANGGIVTVNSDSAADAAVNAGGISAASTGGGKVSVASDSVSVHGANRFGIFANTSGAGTIDVMSGTVANDADDHAALRAQGEAGAITIASTNASSTGTDAFAISAQSTTGAINITSGTVNTSGLGAQGVWAQTTDGDISITAGKTITTATGYDAATGATQDAVFGYSTGNGAVTIASDDAEVAGDYSNAVGGVGGGAVNITSGIAKTAGFQVATVYGDSRNSNVTINATDTSATGVNSYAVEGHANNGDVTITSGNATADHGDAIYATAGGQVTIKATTAISHGDGGTAVWALGGNVALDIGSASSDGTIVTNPQTGATYLADAIFAQATSGSIEATIGSAKAVGQGADAVHLVADGANGAVTATITGTVSSTSGTGLWIDPPGAVNVAIGAEGSVSGGVAGLNLTGSTNSIVNQGTISSGNGPAIIASGQTQLDNSGTIAVGKGAAAVQLGATNDTVILHTGSNVTGAIVGGGGVDMAVLDGTGDAPAANQALAAFSDFDSLTVKNGYWTAGATTSAFKHATVDQGAALELSNGANGITGVAAPAIVTNGTLVVRSGADAGATTFGTTSITGSGNVRFTGTGTASLDGTNTLANTGTNTIDAGATVKLTGTQGGSFIDNGIFQIGNGGTSGNFTGDLVDNGTLIVDRSDAYSFDGALTGSGTFVKNGDGTISFGDGYAFTGTTVLNGGSIKLSGAVSADTQLSLEGSGSVDFSGTSQTVAELAGTSQTAGVNIDGGALTVDQDGSSSFAGTLSGNGSFTKTGSGNLTLAGTNTYSGPTSVNAGQLTVNGSIVSPLTVNAGGTLAGTGTLGDTTIGAGGTWSPGASSGTASASLHQLALRSFAATARLGTQTVDGNVVLAKGSTLTIDVDAAGQSDHIDASGKAMIEGGTLEVMAGAGDYARLTNYTILTAAGGVSGAFDKVTSNFAFLDPLLSYGAKNVTLTLARNDIAFDTAATSANQRSVADAVNARSFGDPIYNTVLVQSVESARSTFDALSGELHASLVTDLVDGDRRLRDAVLEHGVAGGSGLGMWAEALQVDGGSRAQDGLAKLSTNRSGIIGGVDFSAADLHFGVHGGYVDEDISVDARASSAKVKTGFAGASLAWTPIGRIAAQVGATYAWHTIDTLRVIGIDGIAGSFAGNDEKARTAQAYGEISYAAIQGPLRLTPFVRYAHDWTRANALQESGGLEALEVGRDTLDTDSASIGLRFSGTAPVSQGLSFEPRFSIAYRHNWGDLAGNRVVRLDGTGPTFDVAGASLGANALDVDMGASLVTRSGLRFGLGGFANTSRRWGDYGGKASISLNF